MEYIIIGQVILYGPCRRGTQRPASTGERSASADDIGATEHESVDEQCVGNPETSKLARFRGMFFRWHGFGRHDGNGNDHGENSQRCTQVGGDDGWRQLPEYREAAQDDLDDQQHRGDQGGYENLALLTCSEYCADGQGYYKHADDGSNIAVKLLKKRVIVYGAVAPAIAECPLGENQNEVYRPYGATNGDEKISESTSYPRYTAY